MKAIALLASGRYADAAAETDKYSIDVMPMYPVHPLGVQAHVHAGATHAAKEKLEQAWALHGDRRPELFPGAMALVGRDRTARSLLDDAERRFQSGELPVASESFWGEFYLGNLDKAFVWLERAITNREAWLFPVLHHCPILDDIRRDARFQQAMALLRELEAVGTPTRSIAYP